MEILKEQKQRRVAFHTLGCRLNQSETAVMQQSFDDTYIVVPSSDPADIVVVNTCTVTENGDADTRRFCRRMQRVNPNCRIALVGCQAQTQKDKLLELPNVCWVVGNARKLEIRQIIEEYGDGPPRVLTPGIEKKPFVQPLAGIDREHTRANLKIQDGCDFFCSFCEIPYARGRARSRVFADICREAKILARAGHKEIVLTGINIGTYRYQDYDMLDMIKALEDIDGIKRIRISSIEPTTIPNGLLQRMMPHGKVCRYLHIPLQSADDNILIAMKRKYSLKEFDDALVDIHDQVEGIGLGTDIIVGFPGEMDQHFQNSAGYLSDSVLDYAHVFSYSNRSLAKSRGYDQLIDKSVIVQRSANLRDISRQKKQAFHQKFVGKIVDVLFEQKKHGLWWGLTDNYARVAVASEDAIQNSILKVQIVSANETVVSGRLIDKVSK